jgi:hypothetical protein
MRFKQIEKKGEIRYGSVKSIFSNTNNYISLGKFEYSDVIWNVQVPAPDLPYSKEYYLSKISPSSISVKRRPRCPKCETELEEEHSFWGGYVWKCVYCKFKKRKKNSFYE